jgi:hypothetical protein
VTGQWFSPLVSSTNKTEILLKVLLNTITLIKESSFGIAPNPSWGHQYQTKMSIHGQYFPLWVSNGSPNMILIQHYVIKFINDLIVTGQWFSPLVSSTNKTEILLKVLLNTITLIKE